MTTQPSDNIYADLIAEQFSLPVPLLRKSASGEAAYAPCVVLSETMKRQARKKAYADTLKDFDGKAPKADDAGADVWNATFQDHYGAWTIFYAIRVPGNLSKQLFLTKDQLTNDYTPEEIGIMYANYGTVVINQRNLLHFNEDDPNATSSAIDAIIHQNTVEDTQFFLDSYTTRSLAMLVRSLVAQLTTLQSSNGSSGTPSNDTTENVPTTN